MGEFAAGCLASRVWKPTEAEHWPLGQTLAGEARLESRLSCAAGLPALYFGLTPSESLPAVQGCGSDCGPTTLPHGEGLLRVDRDIYSHSEDFKKGC